MITMSASKKEQVTFEMPTIGPKVYIAKDPSGWPATFKREAADIELDRFLSPAATDDVVQIFVAKRELGDLVEEDDDGKPKPITWFTITGFLARTMNTTPLAVPYAVGVAFWAKVLIAFRTKATN